MTEEQDCTMHEVSIPRSTDRLTRFCENCGATVTVELFDG